MAIKQLLFAHSDGLPFGVLHAQFTVDRATLWRDLQILGARSEDGYWMLSPGPEDIALAAATLGYPR